MDDQRFKRVHLTARGHAAGQAIRDSVAEIEAELAQELGPAKFDQLRELLIQLNGQPRPRVPRATRDNGPTTTGDRLIERL